MTELTIGLLLHIIRCFCQNVKLKLSKGRTSIVLSKQTFEVSRSDRRPLVEGAVDLWIADSLNIRDPLTTYRQLMSDDELERSNHFKFDHLRDFHVFCRGTLRRILSGYLAVSPDTIRFLYGENGKPFLATEAALQFNVSHSGSLFVCAVSSNLTIGVDVEEIRPLDDMTSIATHFFSPAEQRHLAKIPEENRTHAFYECWTRKEAVIKATGEGVSRLLDSFEVAFGPGATAQLMHIDDNHSPSWQMASFEPHPGYVGAVTSPVPWNSLRIHKTD